MGLDLDLNDDAARALLQALPTIAEALLSHVAQSPKRIVVVVSTRKRSPDVKVLSRELDQPLDPELQRATATAPKMPMVRVVSLRRDGSARCRDVKLDELTDGEETAPS